MIDSIEEDTKLQLKGCDSQIPFTFIEVDLNAIENYVHEILMNDYTEDNIDGIIFWWTV